MYGISTGLNGLDVWMYAAVAAVVTIAGLVVAALQQPLVEMNAETLVLRDGALRAPIRVPLRHVWYFELDMSSTLRVILTKEAGSAYQSQGALDSPDFGVHYAVPLMWVIGNKAQIIENLNSLLKNSQSR